MSVCPTNGSCIHWPREDHPVHGNGRFHGWEAVFEVAVHKKWCFCGRTAMFETRGQEKCHFSGRKNRRQKRDTPERMSPQHVHYNKAHQRRVIRGSEMFAEHRSSGDARSDRREWPACP